jgi:hypothetical protein
MDIETLVTRLTRTIMQELQAEQQRKTIVLFAKAEQPLPEGLVDLYENTARMLYADDGWQVEDVDRFILPCLHLDQMVDLALGKSGSKMMYAVRQVLLAGREVEVYQYEYRKYLETAPRPLISLYEGYRKQLRGFGLVDCIRCRKNGLRIGKKVVTEADILMARGQGARQLLLSSRCRITPLAHETARNLGIQLSTDTGGGVA